MAEGLLKRRLTERRLDGSYRVRSAGVIAREGDLAPREAVRVAAEHGVDLSTHLATPLTADLVDGANLVVAMDRSNVEDILNLVPDLGPRLRLLNQFAEGAGFDVPDPMGLSTEAFRESYRQIAAGVDGLVEGLAKAAEANRDAAKAESPAGRTSP